MRATPAFPLGSFGRLAAGLGLAAGGSGPGEDKGRFVDGAGFDTTVALGLPSGGLGGFGAASTACPDFVATAAVVPFSSQVKEPNSRQPHEPCSIAPHECADCLRTHTYKHKCKT